MRVKTYKKGGNLSGGFAFNGGSLTGPLFLSGSSEEALEAISKQYVDYSFVNLNANNVKLGTFPVSSLPAFTGDISKSVGSATISLAEINNNVGDVTKVTVNAAGQVIDAEPLIADDIPGFSWNKITQDKPTTLAGYGVIDALPTEGGEINGRLSCSVLPTESMHAVNRQYADTVLASGTGVSIGDIVRKPTKVTPNGFLKANGGKVLIDDYPTLYSVIGDKFNTENQIGNGKPWEQQSEFNESQTTELSSWVKETSLPSILYAGNCFVTKNRVYVCGGYTGSSFVSTVYTANINEDGSLGTWTTGPSLPSIMYIQEMVVIKNKIYVFGGYNGTAALATVYSANIDSAGRISSWVTESSLPGVIGGSKAIITKNRIYLCGGRTVASVAGNSSIVYTATIDENGNLGSWLTSTSLPTVIYGHQIVQIKNRVYLIGGQSSTSDVSTIYLAYINSDGTLGNWVIYSSFPTTLIAVKIITTKNTMYIFGGVMNSVQSNQLYSCAINSDGSLGTFTRRSDIPTPTNWHLAFITSSRIYLVAGHNSTTFDNLIYSAPFSGGLNDYSEYYDIDNVPNYLEAGSGRPWQQQYQINDQQFDNISNWSTSTSLPGPLHASQAIVTKNRVYLLGGWNGTTASSTVYTAPINSDGTLGAWMTGTSLPVPLHASQAIVTKNRVYLLGGDNGSVYVPTVYTASINSDGTLGTWNTGTSLPGAMRGSQAIITKNRVYLLGGYNGSVYVSTVYTAPVNSDGTLGAWSTSTSLPVPLYASQAIITKNRVYLVGGWNGSASVSTVYTAVINSDGTLGAWSTSTSLPGLLHGSQVIVTKNRVYLLGGWNGTANVSTVYTAVINSDGTLGAWSTGSSIHTATHWASAFTTLSKVYLVGGYLNSTTSLATVQVADFTGGLNDYSPYYEDSRPNYMEPGSGRPWQQQYDINNTQSGDITGWTTGTSLPSPVSHSCAIVTKNRVYLLGGTNSGVIYATVWTAIINPDGTLGVWTTGTSLPIPLWDSHVVVLRNKVYLLGGNTTSVVTPNIYVANINSDGTLGTWSLSGTLLAPCATGSVILTKNRIYLMSGYNGSAWVSTIYTSIINVDGTLGSWSLVGNLPGVIAQSQIITTKNRVYLLGGFNGLTYLSSSYTAAINSDGTLGNWTAGPSLPGTICHSNSIVTKNRVYLFSGLVNGTWSSTSYNAPINEDGTLGLWVAGTSLPSICGVSQPIVVNNKIYMLGGYNGTNDRTTVFMANISGGLNDYSQYYQEDSNNYMEPGSGRPWQQQYQINESTTNAISGWTLETSLPVPIDRSQAIVTKNRVYLLGGSSNGTYTSAVYTALINTDGSLGTWTATTSLPGALGVSSAIVIKNRVYLFGGYNGSSVLSTVYTAPINDDGTIGLWSAGTSLPVALHGTCVAVTKTRVYVIGGYTGSVSVNTIYCALINSDGTLGTWTSATSLPVAIYAGHVVITKNIAYIIGGITGSTVLSTIYKANINSDGTLGSWASSGTIPGPLLGSQVIITKNQVYLLGGCINNQISGNVSTVYTAPINSDGTLGSWETSSPINTACDWSQAIITSSRVYLLGGIGTTASLSIIQSASIVGGLNDYSEYYKKEDQVGYFYLPNETNREIFNLTSYIKY